MLSVRAFIRFGGVPAFPPFHAISRYFQVGNHIQAKRKTVMSLRVRSWILGTCPTRNQMLERALMGRAGVEVFPHAMILRSSSTGILKA